MRAKKIGLKKDTPHLLLVDDEQEMCRSLEKLLSEKGFAVSTANSAYEALNILQKRSIDLIICDIVMPDMSGLALLPKIDPKIPIIMMTAYASIETTRKAFKLGARDYLVKPFEFSEMLVLIEQNLETEDSGPTRTSPEKMLESYNDEFTKLLQLADKFAATDMPIIITGESGVGKEILANYVCENSSRNSEPFVTINCAAIPDSLLESELFGYEKGAFTGAVARKQGKFEIAHGGTIFLDEIGDMPVKIQAKILRVLQDFKITRLGDNRQIGIDVRIIAATNKNIQELIDKNEFREDLYHRLNGIRLDIPPLRKRLQDFDMFVSFFKDQFSAKYNKHEVSFRGDTLDLMKKYSWPGNIRELKNCVERAIVVCDRLEIGPEHLPDNVLQRGRPGDSSETEADPTREDLRESYMKKIILDALKNTNGNRNETARLLNISRKTLYNRMKELGIKHEFT